MHCLVRTDRTFERDENVPIRQRLVSFIHWCELTGLLNGMKTYVPIVRSTILVWCELTGLLNGMKTA